MNERACLFLSVFSSRWMARMRECTLFYLVGHVYVVIAHNDNDEKIEYWLARCIKPKKKWYVIK